MANEMTLLVTLTLLIFGVVSGKPFPGQHALATIQMNNGQIFNCVDFYKQPAFANSSLNSQNVPNLMKLQQQKSVEGFGLKGRGCPLGTVPILVHPNSIMDGSKVLESNPLPRLQAGSHCSAKVQTKANPDNVFFGAQGFVSIYKPVVNGPQWSSARIKLLNGDESIEAGWMVNPNEFKDSEAHLYASFSIHYSCNIGAFGAFNYLRKLWEERNMVGGKGCINMDCSGFTQVSTDIPLGVASHKYSQYGGPIVGWNVSIEKHSDDGNWWVSIATNDNQKHQIGYWPKDLFKNLAAKANQVEFGGEINNPGGASPIPLMGNGYFASYDTDNSACFVTATVIDANSNHVDPPNTEKFEDCNLLYTVLDGGHQDDPKLGRLIFFGGPNSS